MIRPGRHAGVVNNFLPGRSRRAGMRDKCHTLEKPGREVTMSIFRARVFSTSLLVGAILCASVSAQPLPAPAVQNGIRYVTGGIGEDEVKAFHSVAPKYNLRVTLSAKSGHYLSDVDVRIYAGTRSLLVIRTAGPFLFAHLPAGQYQISARDRHVTETRKVVVPARGGIDVHFSWEDPDRHDVMQLCTGCRTP